MVLPTVQLASTDSGMVVALIPKVLGMALAKPRETSDTPRALEVGAILEASHPHNSGGGRQGNGGLLPDSNRGDNGGEVQPRGFCRPAACPVAA